MLPRPVASEAGAPALPDLGHGTRHPFVLPPLPYALGALAPAISARTLQFHYHRHHAGYVATLNRLLAGQPAAAAGQSLVALIRDGLGRSTRTGVFNNAAQVWNHSFYWRCLTPSGGGAPTGTIAAAVEAGFGSYATFRNALVAASLEQFGSGWAWLCAEGDRLTLRRTGNAETPIQAEGVTPLLVIDVWEHAYYLDYQNRRADHVAQVIDRLLDWPFAGRILDAHRRQAGLTAAPTGPQPDAGPATRPTRPAETWAASLSRLARRR